MRIGQRIKSLFARRPPTEQELAADKEAEAIREQMRLDRAKEAQEAAQIDHGGL
jgi:hypothetical protein